MKPIALSILLSAACLVMATTARADSFTSGSITVNGTDDIYAAGSQSVIITNCVSVNWCPASGMGTLPGSIPVAGSSYVTLTTSGTITLNDTSTLTNDPDGLSGGNPAYVPASSNLGFESISGITAPGGGYLVGVFIGPGGPSGPAPASLTYTSATTDLASYSPLLDQVFFIGDGLTGDGTGSDQVFYVPTGATQLYLGISDTCTYVGNYPSCYDDNSGTYSNASYTVATAGPTSPSPTPEPSPLILLVTGAVFVAGTLRRA
jgi:hypothetical protein